MEAFVRPETGPRPKLRPRANSWAINRAGGVLVTTNQIVTPIGKIQRIEAARPKDMALSPDGSLVAVLTTAKVLFYKPDGTLQGSVAVKPGPLGLAWQPDGSAVYASGEGGVIYQIAREGERLEGDHVPARSTRPKR